jgi:RimJ/RimL family protein N-acetyltransferase
MAIIREATLDDTQALIAFVKRNENEPNLLAEPGAFNFTVEQEREFLQRFAAAENSIFLVAEHDRQIVGTLGCSGASHRTKKHVVSIGIAVHPDYRRQGIGAALIKSAIEWAQSTLSVRRMELSVFARNQAAIRLYERFGFEIEGRHRQAYCKNGEFIDSFTMALIL